jgi:pimeloyl-ACP methyl ester carboxylesterase
VEEGPHCAQRYWTSARFAPEVIGAMSAALDLLRERFRAKRLILVGYSGGASVAALLAERRTDVVGLVTVAGNLDHRAWTAWHHVSPLTGSLDPVDDVSALQRVPQIHLAGENDRIVPPELLEEFARRIPGAKVEILKGYDHHCCWAENWPAIWRSITWVDPTDR